MKKLILVFVLLLLLPLTALAEEFTPGDKLEVVNCELAPLFSLPEGGEDAQVLTWIPAYEYVTYVGKIPQGCVVSIGTMTGYMFSFHLEKTDYYDYGYTDHGDGSDDLHQDDWNTGFDEGFPAQDFKYPALACKANQRIATRSGPSTKYTEPGSFFKKGAELKVFYQAKGSGVPWGYIEFTYKNQLYRAYTGMKRLDVKQVVPFSEEPVSHYVTLTQSFLPYYGPGYEYATLPKQVPKGAQVPVFFVQDGWIMFDYTLSNGKIQRGWAPLECWEQ